MSASKITKMSSILLPLAAGLLVATCEPYWQKSQIEEPVSAVICNGDPYSCVEAKSEMDAHRPAYVFVDGEMRGLILPSRTLRVPVKAGVMHQVNFCAYSDVSGSKRWKCSTPTDTKFEAGNSILVVFPLE